MGINIISFFKGFKYAFDGLVYVIKTQRNFRVHICIGIAVFWLASFYDFSVNEYVLLVITTALVFAFEIINTSVEAIVDLVSGEYSRLAKIAKDTAASAVLVSALFAVIVGFLLFWDVEILISVAEYFILTPRRMFLPIIYGVIAFIFVFLINNNDDDNKNNSDD